MKFVAKKFKYPREALSKNIVGIIEVSFIVDRTGQPKDFNIVNAGAPTDPAIPPAARIKKTASAKKIIDRTPCAVSSLKLFQIFQREPPSRPLSFLFVILKKLYHSRSVKLKV